MEMSEEEIRAIARNLACPEGEMGLEIGRRMQETNAEMTRAAIGAMALTKGDCVLELGPALCGHLPHMMNAADKLSYRGLEISELMKNEAEKLNAEYVADARAAFSLYDGLSIPFADASFDKAMTVNTLYFWRQPEGLMRELHRVLKPGGRLCIAFVQRSFMEQLPIAAHGFQHYDTATLGALLRRSGFDIVDTLDCVVAVEGIMPQSVDRPFTVISALAGA